MLNPICEVRIDEMIDKRRTHRGVAIAVLVYHKGCYYSCDVYVEEFPAGFLPNLLMNEEISAIKITGRHNGKKLVRFKAIPWTYQRDELKSKLLGSMLNAVGSNIESIAWRIGESLPVGEGNELAQKLEELLKKDVPDIEPEDNFDF